MIFVPFLLALQERILSYFNKKTGPGIEFCRALQLILNEPDLLGILLWFLGFTSQNLFQAGFLLCCKNRIHFSLLLGFKIINLFG